MLIMLMVILDTMKRKIPCHNLFLTLTFSQTARANAYYDEVIGSKSRRHYHFSTRKLIGIADWNSPFTFFNHVYHVKDEEGNLERTITGGIGTFLGVW